MARSNGTKPIFAAGERLRRWKSPASGFTNIGSAIRLLRSKPSLRHRVRDLSPKRTARPEASKYRFLSIETLAGGP